MKRKIPKRSVPVSTIEMSELETLIDYVTEGIRDYRFGKIQLVEFLNRMEFAQYQYRNNEVDYE